MDHGEKQSRVRRLLQREALSLGMTVGDYALSVIYALWLPDYWRGVIEGLRLTETELRKVIDSFVMKIELDGAPENQN